MRRKSTDRGLIFLLASTLVTLILWIGSEIWHAYTRVTVTDVPPKYLEEIDPGLDQTVLDRLESRLP